MSFTNVVTLADYARSEVPSKNYGLDFNQTLKTPTDLKEGITFGLQSVGLPEPIALALGYTGQYLAGQLYANYQKHGISAFAPSAASYPSFNSYLESRGYSPRQDSERKIRSSSKTSQSYTQTRTQTKQRKYTVSGRSGYFDPHYRYTRYYKRRRW